MGISRQPYLTARAAPGEEDMHDPLLPTSSSRHDTQQAQQRPPDHATTSTASCQPAAAVDLGWQFARRLWRILAIINAAPALSLVIMSTFEAIIISRIGTISSHFYQVFVDGQQSKVLHLMLWSAGCYAATAMFYTLKSSLQELFAWRWRAALTRHLQQLYCSNLAFYHLNGVDNPDQRMAQDLPLLTSSLAGTLAVLAAVPFNIVWYTQLTHQVFDSWLPVAAAYLFFAAGAVLQRLAMMPVAAMVYNQEAAEGSYRYKQMRFRAWAQEIALYRSASVEQQQLELQFAHVLACQGRLMLRRAVVTAATKFLEYGGLVVNFACLAVAVFSGAWDADRQSAGGIAAKVSVASFYLLTLIYSFTQVLDLATKVSDLAGLTARVSQLLETLQDQQRTQQQQQQHTQQHTQQQHSPGKPTQQPSPDKKRDRRQQHGQSMQPQLYDEQQQHQQQPLLLVGDGTAPSHKRYACQAVLLQPPQLVKVNLVKHNTVDHGTFDQQPATGQGSNLPTPSAPQSQMQLDSMAHSMVHSSHAAVVDSSVSEQQPEVMQVSIHSLGSDMLLHEVRRAFPDSPRLAPLLAVVTFQFCGSARQLMLQQLLQQQQSWQQSGKQVQQEQQDQMVNSHSVQPCAGVSACEGNQQQQQWAVAAEEQGGGCVLQPGSGGGQHSSSAVTARGRTHSSSTTAGLAAAAAATGSSSGSCACESAAGAAGAAGSCLCSGAEMQRMLEVFMAWQHVVAGYLTDRGYWADAIDPRTGSAMGGSSGSTYDEVIGAQVLLGYSKQQDPGSCPLVRHPQAGTQVYPATLFTSAPLPLLREALKAAAGAAAAGAAAAGPSSSPCCGRSSGGGSSSTGAPNHASLLVPPEPAAVSTIINCDPSSASSTAADVRRSSSPTPPPPPAAVAAAAAAAAHAATANPMPLLLACYNLSVTTPSGLPIVRDLTVSLTAAGGSLLIRGPSGCGKSTLLRCLAGLWPADAGRFSIVASAAAASGGGGGTAPYAASGWHSADAAGYGCEKAESYSSSCAGGSSRVSTAGTLLQQQQEEQQQVGAHMLHCAAAAAGVMFLPQRMLAAPGQTLREQLTYPAASSAFACSCDCSSTSSWQLIGSNPQPAAAGSCEGDVYYSSSRDMRKGSRTGWTGREAGSRDDDRAAAGDSAQVAGIMASGDCSSQQQQQQQRRQHCGVSDWWEDWLTCGITRRSRQHQQWLWQLHQNNSHQQQHGCVVGQPTATAGIISAAAAGQHCGSCQHLLVVLQQVGLSYLLDLLPAGLDTAVDDWGLVLSPGEMQRLGFARVLLHRPLLAVLDEATSSLPAEVAVQLYQQLQAAGVSYVSVGHSSSLLSVHKQVLSIAADGRGSWQLQ